MGKLTLTEALKDGLALYGPGFTGAGWHAGGAVLEVFELPFCDPCEVPENLLTELAAFCADIPAGGAVAGYIGYEAAAALMPELGLPAAPDGLPIVRLVKYAQMQEVAFDRPDLDVRRPSSVVRPRAEGYRQDVQQVRGAIREGEIFQANISRRLSAEFVDEERLAATLFARMVGERPAPYAAYIPLEKGAVLSNSPELFLAVDGQKVAAEPVKGTAPRGASPAVDRAMAHALRTSEKDRAENIMIADLLRNDLAKVCEDHSITEPAVCALRTLPAVHHLYSRVEGRLREGVAPIEVLAAAFPCGSITGAPKHRAMQVIARLEKEGRGPYCGAICYLPAKGQHIFSVPIRTAVLSQQEGHSRLDYRSGGGVTLLSDPQAEYLETEDKAYSFEAMLK